MARFATSVRGPLGLTMRIRAAGDSGCRGPGQANPARGLWGNLMTHGALPPSPLSIGDSTTLAEQVSTLMESC